MGLNPGYHVQLRRSARRLCVDLGPADSGSPADRGKGLRLLDLGCGTGASTAALLEVVPDAEIVAVDTSARMLDQARCKSWPPTVEFVHARAEHLDAAGVSGPFDGVFAAYLVRNLRDPDPTLRHIRALLRPGGRLAVHEYSVADSAVSRAVWRAVCAGIIIPAGRLLSGDATLYRYLHRSVLDFDGVRALSARLRRAGFTGVHVQPMSGWQRGIVHTFVAHRPAGTTVAPRTGAVATTTTTATATASGRRRASPSRGSTWYGTTRPGRDRRAGLLPVTPPPSDHAASSETPRVAVVGGGIAGVTAAVALAERGIAITVYEREPHLGGRLAGWPTTLRDGSTATMSRGFHAFFRQYYNLRALLRRVDPGLGSLVPLRDYPLVHASGARDSFVRLPRVPPWSALTFALTSPTFSLRDLSRVNARAALPLLDVSVPDIYERLDGIDALTFLERIRFPPAARDLAFSVFSRSFFADPRQLSAAELATMFHLYFLGSSEGLPFDVPARPFPQAIWNPLADYLASLGADLRLGAAVDEVARPDDGHFVVRTTGGEDAEVDGVVLACDVGGLRDVVAASPDLGDAAWRDRIAAQRSAPPFLVSRLWLARPVAPERPAFLGTAGFGPLDNVSVLERYEDEARAWARRTGGSVVELHAYAVPAGTDPATLRGDLLAQLHRLYPETAGVDVVDERTELRADCPLFPPGGFAGRPPVTTPDPGVVLAGDLVRVDAPVALMERAATSGLLAANQLLASWGRPTHPVWSVPNAGRWRAFRALAAHFAP
ncbi:FAD-dependent oxidoreductase [Actinopolymorpha sp. B9G3]|uniref:FAD-dependent oxidoreductase n=1 Tax=Actinopolymorpha sp. B9G3 TaxID=3158970 RepID=UPI0032D91A31